MKPLGSGATEITITGEHHDLAQELHRRRVAAGQGIAPNFQTALAEVAFLDAYERKPMLADLTIRPRSLQFIVTDEDNNTVRVIQQRGWPIRVWSNRLDVDSYVFATTTESKTVQLHGWAPTEQVENASIHWLLEDNERKDYAFEMYRELTYPMPTEFKFTDRCPHQREYGAIWNYTYDAWECFGCGRYLNSRDEAARIQRQDACYGRAGGPPPPTPKEP